MKSKQFLALAAMLLCTGSAFAQQPSSFSEPRLIAKTQVGLMAPVWSPDGSQIAMTGDNYTGIFVANADGSQFKMVSEATGAGYQMKWTGNSEIVSTPWTMSDNRRMTRIESVDIKSGSVKLVAQAERNFKRSQITSGSNNLLKIMVDDPLNATKLISSLNAFEGKMVINPTLSPNGKKIAFQIVGKGLMVCDADGSNLKSLGKYSHASWMPNSDFVMAARIVDNGDVFTQSDIYCIDVVNGKVKNITPQSDVIPITLAVSPDGSKVAFDNDTDGAIYIIDLNY